MLREVLVGAQAGAEAEPILLTFFLVYVQQLFLYLPGPPAYGGLGLNLLPRQSTTGTKITTQTGSQANLLKGIPKLQLFLPR